MKGGTGGSGLSKYGGIGGRGGDVYIKAKENFSLRDLSKYIKNKNLVAGTGFDSSKKGILGEPGEDLIINVPAGVVAYHENGSKIGKYFMYFVFITCSLILYILSKLINLCKISCLKTLFYFYLFILFSRKFSSNITSIVKKKVDHLFYLN